MLLPLFPKGSGWVTEDLDSYLTSFIYLNRLNTFVFTLKHKSFGVLFYIQGFYFKTDY